MIWNFSKNTSTNGIYNKLMKSIPENFIDKNIGLV